MVGARAREEVEAEPADVVEGANLKAKTKANAKAKARTRRGEVDLPAGVPGADFANTPHQLVRGESFVSNGINLGMDAANRAQTTRCILATFALEALSAADRIVLASTAADYLSAQPLWIPLLGRWGWRPLLRFWTRPGLSLWGIGNSLPLSGATAKRLLTLSVPRMHRGLLDSRSLMVLDAYGFSWPLSASNGWSVIPSKSIPFSKPFSNTDSQISNTEASWQISLARPLRISYAASVPIACLWELVLPANNSVL